MSLWFPLPRARAILLKGEDALGWLQGQVTQDLRSLPVGGSLASAMATPTGQLEAILRIGRVPEGLAVVTDGWQQLLQRVEDLVIMEDVEAELLEGEVWTEQMAPRTDPECRLEGGRLSLWSPRSREGGWDHVGVQPGKRGPEALLDSLQLAAGLPSADLDTHPKTLVSELGEAFLEGHVSYVKGCYTGQEVIHRIHARGRTNQAWRAVVFASEPSPSPLTAGGEPAGTLMRAVPDGGGRWLGSAMVKTLHAEQGAILTAKGPHGEDLEGRVELLPLA